MIPKFSIPEKDRVLKMSHVSCLILVCVFVLFRHAMANDSELSDSETRPAITDTITLFGKGLSLHKQTYLMPLSWGNRASKLEDAELKFQLSLKQRIFQTNFYVAYTQKSFWRVLDDDDSRPFRETNYNPEFFYRLLPKNNPLGKWWGGNIGYEHESNGSKEPTSRSWDRLYVSPFFEYKRFRADLKIWYKIDEGEEDDNPDIQDYYGYAQLKLAYEWPDNHMLSMISRFNPEKKRGGCQFDYSLPSPSQNIFFFAQLWTGYGESLIDYNNYITSFGFGVMFKR